MMMTVSDKINLAIAICSGLSAVVAAAYTFVTTRILKASRDSVSAMRDQVHALSRPRIQIWPSARVGTPLICLNVRNSGPTAADHVSLTVDKDFFVFGEPGEDRNLRNFSAFKQPFETLGPGAEMIFYLGAGAQLFGSQCSDRTPLQFTIQAGYDSSGHSYREVTTVDLLPFLNSAVPQDPIAEEVEKVWKELETCGDELKHIRLWLASSDNSRGSQPSL
jgi:hypothetical protein